MLAGWLASPVFGLREARPELEVPLADFRRGGGCLSVCVRCAPEWGNANGRARLKTSKFS